MIRIAHVPADQAAAARLRAGLIAHGYAVAEANALDVPSTGREPLIVVHSHAAASSAALETAVLHAHDTGQPIVLVKAGSSSADEAPLSRWLDHLPAVDLASDVNLRETRALLDAAQAGGLQMRVLTPAVQQANRRAGAVVAVIALIVFGLGLYGVGVLGIQRPNDEFEAIDTQVVLTRDVLVRPELDRYAQFLPADPAAPGVDFAPTLRLVPTAYRPLLSMTATAYAQGTPLPPTATPSE